jgi:hypothetical protein
MNSDEMKQNKDNDHGVSTLGASGSGQSLNDWQCPQCGKMVARWRKTCPYCQNTTNGVKEKPSQKHLSGRSWIYIGLGFLGLVFVTIMTLLIVNPYMVIDLFNFTSHVSASEPRNTPIITGVNLPTETSIISTARLNENSQKPTETKVAKTDTITVTDQSPTETKVAKTDTITVTDQSPSVPLINVSPDKFIIKYYSLISKDQCQEAYNSQTDNYQTHYSSPYDKFLSWCKKWDKVDTSNVKIISNSTINAEVSVTVTFYLNNNSYPYNITFHLISDNNGGWLIADN